jgi:hypothetical protein
MKSNHISTHARKRAKIVAILLLLSTGTIVFYPAFIMSGSSSPPQVEYVIRLHVIPLSDDDGKRGNTVTPDQIHENIKNANEVFAQAGIQFVFDEKTDWTPMKDTELNSMHNSGANWWVRPNKVANQYLGKLVIFLRWGGTGSEPKGNAFAYPPRTGAKEFSFAKLPTDNVNFVAFYNQTKNVAPNANISTFPHELGHYLGLYHTFPGWGNPSVEQVKEFVEKNGAAGLDGDGLADTPPDAGTLYYTSEVSNDKCNGPESYTVGGKKIAPNRNNLMSYFGCKPYELSSLQIKMIKQTLRHPTRSHLIGDARYAAIWEKSSGPAWVARHGMTSAQYQQEFDKYGKQGYRLAHVNGYNVGGKAYYAAIWEKSAGPARAARHGMTSAQYQQEFDKYAKQGYRLVHVSGYGVSGKAYYAAIWDKSAGPAWVARHGMTSAQYQQEFDKYGKEGYRLVHVSGYGVSGKAHYAAIWEKKSGPAWAARHGMTSAQYQEEFDKYGQQGYRLVQVSGYNVGGQAYFAAIWEKASGPAWVARHGMASGLYQFEFDKLVQQGYRLILVSGYSS